MSLSDISLSDFSPRVKRSRFFPAIVSIYIHIYIYTTLPTYRHHIYIYIYMPIGHQLYIYKHIHTTIGRCIHPSIQHVYRGASGGVAYGRLIDELCVDMFIRPCTGTQCVDAFMCLHTDCTPTYWQVNVWADLCVNGRINFIHTSTQGFCTYKRR